MSHDAFISHSSSDKAIADATCAALETKGIRCWIAPRDIRPGANYAQAITDAIHGSSVFVLVFSSASNSSPQVKREVDRAVSLGLPIVPVRVEDVTPSEYMEYYLAGQHWLDALTPPLEAHLAQLAEAVQTLLRLRDGTPAEDESETRGGPKTPEVPAGKGWRGRRRLAIVGVVAFVCIVAAAVGAFALAGRKAPADPSQSSSGTVSPGQSSSVGVSAQRIENDDGWTVAFRGGMPEKAYEIEGEGHGPAEVYDWLRSCGAVDYAQTLLRVTVRGLANDTVVVRNIRAETDKAAPYSGTSVNCQPAGANTATVLVLDLDENAPEAWAGAQRDRFLEPTGSTAWFDRHNVTLAKGEVHDFVIAGITKRSLVRWHMVIDLEVGSTRQTLTVDDSGSPFVTSGVPASGFTTSLEYAWWETGTLRYTFVPAD
jgi:hypothetical protein